MRAGEGVTLAAYATRWVQRRRVRGRPLRLRTVVGYERVLRLHVLPALGQVPVGELTRRQVRSWYDELVEVKGAGVAAGSYALLRAICATAVEDELLTTTPCSLRGAGKRWSPERPVLTVEQLLALAAAIAPRYRAVVLLGGFCCLRIGELSALQRSAVDLQAATVTVRASAGYIAGHGFVIGEPKSVSSRRVVTIPAAVLPDVQAHLERYVGPEPEAVVFTGPLGGRLPGGAFAGSFAAARGRLRADKRDAPSPARGPLQGDCITSSELFP